MHFNPTHILFLAALASAVPTEMGSMEPRSPAGSELDARAAGKWEAHAKYYALGGKVGSEIYISGTWTDPIKNPGQPSGTCTARIGGISGGTPNVVGCNCEISATGPLKFESTCFLDFAEEASNGDWAAGFSVAFKCSAFFSCTGSNAYSIASANSACKNTSGTPCAGFHVTPRAPVREQWPPFERASSGIRGG